MTITVVTGPAGSGKTTWIQQQLSEHPEVATYTNIGAGIVPIDATYLATKNPELVLLTDTDEVLAQNLEQVTEAASGYFEVGSHIDLKSLVLPFEDVPYLKVAIVPDCAQTTEWHDWADLVISGEQSVTLSQSFQIWRSVLTGQVVDPASLNTFWDELIHGAYGHIQRAKGIFDVADGRAFYFNFVARDDETNPHLSSETTYVELNLPRWLDGRPDRFSGIEVIGDRLDQGAIALTLQDCCLDDQAIFNYQQQLREFMNESDQPVAI